MSSSNDTLDDWYTNATIQINRYLTIIVFCFGTIGNILNILILSQRPFRSNPCIWLFLISSYANLLSILFGLTTRIKSGWSYDVTDTNACLCKIRAFIVFTSRTIASWLITLATINRWASSCINANYRRMNTLRKAQQGTIIIILISILLYVHMFYCYDANRTDVPLNCYSKTILCRHLTDLTYGFITVLCPLFLMFIFGFMTILNVRQSKRRTYNLILKVIDQNNTKILDDQHKRLKKKPDYHLLLILFVQIFLLTLLTLPQAIQKIYSTIIQKNSLNSLDEAINDFIYSFVLLLSFIASGIPFYIYTLCGGNIFRRALYNLINMIKNKITCQSLEIL
ncbi:unnamed protein product [Rotaria sp. Silwood2]|nr:unnamed protein product [Rotaria sp. Silwood2]CAF4085062.1 unnamed protein product [Rotaria sp. Silwood2]